MSQAAGNNQSLAEKLKDARVQARHDLEISRHVFMGEASYIVRDPISFQGHRFSLEDYRILSMLSGDKSLSEVFANLVSQGTLSNEEQDSFYEFVVNLQRLGMLTSPFTDVQALYKRYQGKVKAKQKSYMMALLSFKVPLWNPDTFLKKTMPYASFLFSQWFFCVWCFFLVIALGILWVRAADFGNALSGLLAASNIPILWTTLVGLKVLHEFGHAYACRRYGGYVPEMGAMLMLLTPCAYVDASSSWSFPKRWHRVVVGLGGMYFESIAAIIATFVWATTSPGLVNSAAHQVILLASIVTIGFNINPLMRYDGYYIMGDVLGLPNFRQMSIKQVQGYCKRILFGIPVPPSDLSRSLKIILTVYGSLASVYKIVISLGMCAAIAMMFYWVGMMVGAIMLVTTFTGMITKACKYLWFSKELANYRKLAIGYSVVLLATGPLVLLFCPIPGEIEALGVVGTDHEQIVRLDSPGFVSQVDVEPGEEVHSGQSMVVLRNTELEAALQSHRAELAKVRTELRGVGRQDPVAASKLKRQLEYLEQQIVDATRKLDQLQVKAELDGRVMQSISFRKMDAYVPAGEPICTVGSGCWKVKAVANALEIADSLPQVGQEVECKFRSQCGHTFIGKVTKVSPAGSNVVGHPQLTQLGGGFIAVDPSTMQAQEPFFEVEIVFEDDPNLQFLSHGMVANVRFERGFETVGRFLYRQLLRFKNNLLVG